MRHSVHKGTTRRDELGLHPRKACAVRTLQLAKGCNKKAAPPGAAVVSQMPLPLFKKRISAETKLSYSYSYVNFMKKMALRIGMQLKAAHCWAAFLFMKAALKLGIT